MAKQVWKPSNMVYPAPAAMVTVADEEGNDNIITAAWVGNICSTPAMAYVSVRKERHSYHMIKETGEFVINLTTKRLARATDYCGVRSGRDVDKWKEMKLTRGKAETLSVPVIAESPVNVECKVVEAKDLGSHVMFIGMVTAVQVDDDYMNEKGKFDLTKTGLMAYAHGEYLELGKKIGTFGFSVKEDNEEENFGRKTVMKPNITLIGMPSSGKSTVGVLLAKRLGYSFVDVDIVIQEKEGRLLKEIIAAEGMDGFMEVENRVNAELDVNKSVIAPGGSIIYGEEAMAHLKEISEVVYLKLSYEEVVERIGNVVDRGVVLKNGMTLLDLYNERVPYYEKYADITIDEKGMGIGETVDKLRAMIEEKMEIKG